ncbi:phosphate acetyltransferase [Buchnera aphidicola]|uniref:phosphate acetyltransferase n=1 Tax=Buchnera aphidicola TaxID=9 RepID=UPI003464C890
MLRTIMFVPISNSIGITSTIISFMNIFKDKGFRILFFKPFYENYRFENHMDDTKNLLKKYCDIEIVSMCNKINKNKFFTKECYIKYLVKYNLELYYKYYNQYDIIFIEGIKNFSKEYYVHDFNMNFIKKICPEIIFYTSQNNNIENFLNLLKFCKDNINIEKNILNIIINNIHLHPKKIYNNIVHKHSFTDKIFSYFSSKIINIPVYSVLLTNFFQKLFFNLKIFTKIQKNDKIHLIESFILYDNDFVKKYHYCNYNVIILPLDINFIKFLEKFNNLFKNFNIHSILLTNINTQNYDQIKQIKNQYSITIPIFYTFLKKEDVVYVLNAYYNHFFQINKSYFTKIIKKFTECFCANDFFQNTLEENVCYKRISSFVFQNQLVKKAKKICRNILLPEGEDIRILKATSIVSNLNIAKCTLLGNPKVIYNIMQKENIKFLNNVDIIDPKNVQKKYIDQLLHLRCSKGMTKEIASISVRDNMTLGALILQNNEVDGLVCGIKYSTADVLRAALQIIGVLKNQNSEFSLVSSVFFMLFNNCVLVYGDCAINISPNAEQLSEIAIQSANLASKFFIQPRIAMLSYSTGISGVGETVEKVRKATQLVKKRCPNLVIDGPIQYDAASNLLISQIKSSDSILKGNANVFIFPDLNSGNITYKAVQQSSDIISIGPILQGLKKPINDLSRGASINDIVYTIAITAIQADQ